LLSEENIEKIAKESKFKSRESKITPKMFFENLMIDAMSTAQSSLNMQCLYFKQEYQVEASKQGLSERYNLRTVEFMKTIMSQAINHTLPSIDAGWLGCFNKVRIKDGTRFDLPEQFAEEMPGFGGSASTSGACIQFEFDIKAGSIQDINITPANRPDSKDAGETMDNVDENDLIIRDLGYFSTDVFSHFWEKGAHVLSRLNTSVQIYHQNDKQIETLDFKDLYNWMTRNNLTIIDKQVLVSEKNKLPMRLVAQIVPEEVYRKRLERAAKSNKKKIEEQTEKYKARARFNLFVTDLPSEMIPANALMALYHIRWQIELVFKIWKSSFCIDHIKKMKYERWLCQLIAKVIAVLLNWQVTSLHRYVFYQQQGLLLSYDKCHKTLIRFNESLLKAIKSAGKKVEEFIWWSGGILSQKHWLEKKKKKLNFEEILYLEFC